MVDMKSLVFGPYSSRMAMYSGKMMTPQIIYNWTNMDPIEILGAYIVEPWQEMRIDLVINSIYGESTTDLEATDVILAINGIDNPLNIKAGMRILYPEKNNIDNWRGEPQELKEESKSVVSQLAVANKNTRVDEKRKAFVNNGYSLPPTVNKTPIPPVRIEGNNAVFGGVK